MSVCRSSVKTRATLSVRRGADLRELESANRSRHEPSSERTGQGVL
jgi:hypothetical protein